VLVDDHDLFRGGLRDVLEDSGVRVVGEAGDGDEAVELVARVEPDVAVMDLNMPGTGGVEATRRIVAGTPSTRVLVLTISADDDLIADAIAAGAWGYLLKDASVEEIAQSVRTAAVSDGPR
jgi:DNA-binding NarL/FixJ family response regulator